MSENVVLATGGFDPLHKGHIEYLKAAAKIGDKLIVGVNSDSWLERKKGHYFMNIEDRKAIVSNLSFVDGVIDFDDSDDSAADAINRALEMHTRSGRTLIFANGGDRNNDNSPEPNKFKDNERVVFAYNIGGSLKLNSSDSILSRWSRLTATDTGRPNKKVYRKWGYYTVLQDEVNCRVKELVIDPNGMISKQRHFKRSEFWYLKEGFLNLSVDYESIFMKQRDRINIPKETWHRAINPSSTHQCRVIEIQYGDLCVEEDIERA